jgi:ubiquinone/menaquinone biosynthesis C-methylase UbiE
MKKNMIDIYRCPLHHLALRTTGKDTETDVDINSGELVSREGAIYHIENGVPDFTLKDRLSNGEEKTKKAYDETAGEIYENAIDWLFKSFYENEELVREKMIDLLEIKSESKVLEVGCGTGRDSIRIAKRLGTSGSLFLQDLSRNMILKTRERFERDTAKLRITCEPNYFTSSATYLPFQDGYFDAVFHFGGFNEFSEKRKTLFEFSRIVKKGGKVVFGDESVAPWLMDTEIGKIIATNNQLYCHTAPIEFLPENSRNVILRWILGCCFYLIDFRVGDGLPPINIDLPHKGKRGGTMRTRYYGQLEGVTLEAKKMAIEAAKKNGLSLHDWLDKCVREGSRKDVEKQ